MLKFNNLEKKKLNFCKKLKSGKITQKSVNKKDENIKF
jgi:hypothetical protein